MNHDPAVGLAMIVVAVLWVVPATVVWIRTTLKAGRSGNPHP